MSIQFQCSQCQQPIEVDDEYAGRSAACPYCRSVNTVPQESTYCPDGVVSARPATGGEPGGMQASFEAYDGPGAHPAVLTVQEVAARRYGTMALVCAGLVAVLLIVSAAMLMPMMNKLISQSPNRAAPTVEELAREIEQHPEEASGVFISQCLQTVVAVVGMIVGVISLMQRAAGNWRAWIGVVVCGLSLLGVCAGMVL